MELPSTLRAFSLVLLLLLFNLPNSRAQQVQKFTLHRNEDCSDAGEVYSRNVRNLQKVSPLITCGAMKCFCNHYGVWTFSGRKSYKQSFLTPIKSGVSAMQIPGKKCFTRKLNWKFVQLLSIRHIGSKDATEPSLSLYTDTDYFGKELFIDGQKLSLPEAQTFHSYGFTGNRSWMLLPNTNFTGDGTCLQPMISNDLITHELNVSFTVGSVIQGCPKAKKFKFFRNATSSVTLYMETNSSKLAFDGSELRLPSPIEFIEFSLSAEDKWTIYAGTEFGGKFRCLTRFGQFLPGQLRKYRFKREPVDYGETWLIGSVRRGCFPVPGITYPEYDARDYEDEDEEDDFWKNRKDEMDWAVFNDTGNGTLEGQIPTWNGTPNSGSGERNSANRVRRIQIVANLFAILGVLYFILHVLNAGQ